MLGHGMNQSTASGSCATKCCSRCRFVVLRDENLCRREKEKKASPDNYNQQQNCNFCEWRRQPGYRMDDVSHWKERASSHNRNIWKSLRRQQPLLATNAKKKFKMSFACLGAAEMIQRMTSGVWYAKYSTKKQLLSTPISDVTRR